METQALINTVLTKIRLKGFEPPTFGSVGRGSVFKCLPVPYLQSFFGVKPRTLHEPCTTIYTNPARTLNKNDAYLTPGTGPIVTLNNVKCKIIFPGKSC